MQEQNEEKRQTMIKRNRASLQLTIAQEVINGLSVTKFGRRGRPHATHLIYDPTFPLALFWKSKNGEKSANGLDLNLVISVELGIKTPVLIKAGKKHSVSISHRGPLT